jgi:MFS family permease
MREVLRAPGALALFAASCVARLPMGALGLLLVLHTHDLTGSYARGGLASGAYAFALGTSNPALARTIDRRGQTPVLRIGAPLATASILGLAMLPDGAPLILILACAIAAGVFQPPIGACMRALWPELLDGPERRHAAYALEGAVVEIVYICGPLAIVAGIGSWSITAALVACAASLLAGNLAFSAQRASRDSRPHPDRPRDVTGALRGRGVRVLVAVFFLCGLAVGAVEVAVPAALDGMGHRELTGLLLGLWGVGSMLAGFATGRAGAAADPPRRLVVLLAAWGIGHGAIGLAETPAILAALLLVAGATIAPTIVCVNGMLDGLAPRGALTEAFTWTATGLVTGIAAGSATAGALVQAASPTVATGVLGAGGVAAALLVRAASTGPLRAPATATA